MYSDNSTPTDYQITAIRAFSDNYIWAIRSANNCCVVDPGEAEPVLEWLKQENLQLKTILLTHQHQDHIGGVAALVENTGAQVYGPADSRMPATSRAVIENDVVHAADLAFNVIEVPGHTSTHIAYYAASAEILFCGDTLFSMGCGRLFEGSPKQMLASLDKLAALPDSTKVYCTHEYTLANANFALAVEPDNRQLQERHAEVVSLRNNGQATLPSNMLLERLTNPFLRCDQAAIIAAAKSQGAAANGRLEVFTAIRKWKDNF